MKLSRKQVERYDTLHNKMYLRADEIVSYYLSLEGDKYSYHVSFYVNGDTLYIEYWDNTVDNAHNTLLLNVDDFVGNWKEVVNKMWKHRMEQRIKREEERKIAHQQILDNMNERLKQSP
jgi:hypothetical protein